MITTLERIPSGVYVQKHVDRDVAYDALLAAATTIEHAVLVATNANGELVNAADTAGLTVVGRAPQKMANAGGAAAKINPPARAEAGVFKFGTTGGNAITAADVGKSCFVLDASTVVRQAGTVNAIVAGVVDRVEADGVWVKVNC